MVSSEHPSGSSCSFKSVAPDARADPSTSFSAERPAPAPLDPADLALPCPKFSIRDYVFDSRSKGIKRGWPFHPKSLEFCLKRGVKDLLPPFEPPDLIRSKGFYTLIDSDQSAATCPEADASAGLVKTRDVGMSSANTTVIISHSCQSVDELHGQTQCGATIGGKSAIDQGHANEADHTDELIQSSMKDSSCTKVLRRTEVGGASCRLKNLVSWRDSPEMKWKLLVKSGSMPNIRQIKDVASNSSSFVDPKASKTCPVCKVFASTSNTTLNAHIDQCLSVESNSELVIETAFVKQKVKPRKKQLMVDIYKTALPYTLEDLDRRNGTNWAVELAEPTMNKEVCIKNRGPEVVPCEARNGDRDRDVYVDSNGIKIRILSKSSDVPLVWRDELSSKKVAKRETGKGISISKPFLKSKTSGKKRFKLHGKKCNRLSHLDSEVQAYPNVDMHDDASVEETVRQRVCSNRADLTKNFGRNLTNKASGFVTPGTKKLARSRMLGFDDSNATEIHFEAVYSQSLEDMDTTSEANDYDAENVTSRLIGTIPRWSSKNSSSNGVIPKEHRSAAALAKQKIKEIGRREAYKSDNYDKVKNSTLAKSSEAHSLSFSNAGLSNEPNRLLFTSKIFRRHRSLLRTRRREFSHSLNGFGQDHGLDERHVNKKVRVTNDSSMKAVKHTQEDTAENNLSFGSNVPGLGQGDDQYDVAQQTSSTHMSYEVEEPATEVQYASTSRNTLEDSCSEVISGPLSPENSKTAYHILAKGCSVAMDDRCSTKKLMYHPGVSNIVTNNEVEEWQTVPAQMKESSACFTNKKLVLGAPRDNSSITSNRQGSNQDHGLAFDQDLSESPISNMPPPNLLKDLSNKEKENMFGSSNKKSNSMPLGKEGEHLPKEKTFCCSCRESISKESELTPPESETAKSVTFLKKQVSQLHIGLRTSSSFSTYQRADTKTNPCLVPNDQPLTSRVSAESTMVFPSYMTDYIRPSLQTQLPSPSSPMLRLMGKNLIVMNNEESGHLQLQAPSSDRNLRGNYMPPIGFTPPNYQHGDFAPSISNHQIPQPTFQAGNFVGTPFQGGSMVQPNQYPLQEPYSNFIPMMHHPAYMMKEVIVINDPPECRSGSQVSAFTNTMAPRPSYYLPSPSQVFPREGAVGSIPVFANISPMVVVTSSNQRNQVMRHNPYMSNPLHVNAPTGYISPSAQYQQNLR